MSKGLTKKLIQKGTVIIERLNTYRRGICTFGKMLDLGFKDYENWKREVFNHLYDNGIDEVKLDYLWEDDFSNRNYLNTCRAVENEKTKNKALDEVTKDVNRLIKELIELKPFDHRPKIIISDKKGIYKGDDETMCYTIRESIRLKIIRLLNEGAKDSRTIYLSLNKDSEPDRNAIKNIKNAIDKINDKFKDCVCCDFNLIIKHETKKYELNNESFEIIFTE